jgi:hypothetical protein
MLEPVKPLTTPTPSFWAARAVFFISSTARWLTPAGSPSPQTYSGRIALCRLVDVVEHGLPDEVVRDREQLQVVLFEQLALAGAVGVVGERLVDFEMVAPAGQFEPVVAEVRPFGRVLPTGDRPIGR